MHLYVQPNLKLQRKHKTNSLLWVSKLQQKRSLSPLNIGKREKVKMVVVGCYMNTEQAGENQ